MLPTSRRGAQWFLKSIARGLWEMTAPLWGGCRTGYETRSSALSAPANEEPDESSSVAGSPESSGSGCAALVCSAFSAWMDLRSTVSTVA